MSTKIRGGCAISIEMNSAMRKVISSASGHAAKKGHISKPKRCENCRSSGKLHGHHPDYRNCLEVIWLCPTCHRRLHAKRLYGDCTDPLNDRDCCSMDGCRTRSYLRINGFVVCEEHWVMVKGFKRPNYGFSMRIDKKRFAAWLVEQNTAL